MEKVYIMLKNKIERNLLNIYYLYTFISQFNSPPKNLDFS